MPKALVNKKLLLKKFPGKGGWTFTVIQDIHPDHKSKFGMIRVKGTIDGYAIKKYHLMPMKSGDMFLPVSAVIRKNINKKEGDEVQVVLYKDDDPVEVPLELMMCIEDEPKALDFFNKLSDTDKQNYIDWIYSAKREATKVDRMAKTIEKLTHGKSFYDKDWP